eukprot:s3718_g3.t1
MGDDPLVLAWQEREVRVEGLRRDLIWRDRVRRVLAPVKAMTSATARRRRYMDRTASNHPTLQKTESRQHAGGCLPLCGGQG